MPHLVYNLEEMGGAAIDPGRYRGRVIKIEQGISRAKNPMLTWTWKIVAKGPYKGKKIRSWTSLVEGALDNLKEHLVAFKLPNDVDMGTAELVGRYAILVVTTTVLAATPPRVSRVNFPGTGP